MKVTYIDLDLTLKPEKERLSAKCVLEIENTGNRIPFFLNKQLKIKNIKLTDGDETSNLVPSMKELSEDAFLKACNLWELEYSNQNNLIKLQLEYEGTIESDPWGTNYLIKDAVELGIYVGYYPVLNVDDKPGFKLSLKGPDNWKWLVNAPKIDGRKHLIWGTKESRIDLYLIGLPSEHTIEKPSIFWGRKKNFDLYENLSTNLEEMEASLREWLGETPSKDFHLALVPRKSGGLISRNGLISMQDNLDKELIKKHYRDLLFSWTHEIGHFWFSKTSPTTYHNWLDEALCDFCALLIAKGKFGEDFYEEKLLKIKRLLNETEEPLPALISINRSHPQADLLFYKYGTLVLVNLMEKIGEEKVKRAIEKFAQKCVNSIEITTEDFLSSLHEVTGKDWHDFMNDKLSKPPAFGDIKEEEK